MLKRRPERRRHDIGRKENPFSSSVENAMLNVDIMLPTVGGRPTTDQMHPVSVRQPSGGDGDDVTDNDGRSIGYQAAIEHAPAGAG